MAWRDAKLQRGCAGKDGLEGQGTHLWVWTGLLCPAPWLTQGDQAMAVLARSSLRSALKRLVVRLGACWCP